MVGCNAKLSGDILQVIVNNFRHEAGGGVDWDTWQGSSGPIVSVIAWDESWEAVYHLNAGRLSVWIGGIGMRDWSNGFAYGSADEAVACPCDEVLAWMTEALAKAA